MAKLTIGNNIVLNNGYIYVDVDEILPEGVVFNNTGFVSIQYLKITTKKILFNNTGNIYIRFNQLSKNMIFNNKTRIIDIDGKEYRIEDIPFMIREKQLNLILNEF